MTKSTITRERLEWLSQISCRDDIEDIGGDEIRELASMALAAMDSEPVAYMYRQVQELRNRFGTCDEWEINCRLVESDFPAVEIPESEDYEFLPLYRHAQQPVVDADDNFYSWFGREWAENYQHNQYTTAAKQMLGVMAESAWKAATERQRQKQSVSVPDVKMYEDVPYEVGRLKTHRDCYCDGWNACRAAMLAAAQQEVK